MLEMKEDDELCFYFHPRNFPSKKRETERCFKTIWKMTPNHGSFLIEYHKEGI